MSAKFWETKEFRKLQKKWYDKLDEGGFKDIERNHEELHTDTARFKDMEAVKTYYDKVGAFLHAGEFANLQEKAMWFMYAEGASIRTIAGYFKVSRPTVTKILNSYIVKMGGAYEPLSD